MTIAYTNMFASWFAFSLGLIFLLASYSGIPDCMLTQLHKAERSGYCEPEKPANASNLKAFVIGSTGQTGKAIASALSKSEAFDRVTLFVRRPLEDTSQGDTDNVYSKFDVKVVDFDHLETDHAKDFEGYDVGYCSIALWRSKPSEEEKRRVERDYAVAAAKLAKAGGCNNFNIITANGANKDSSVFAYSLKGWIEHDMMEVGFERLAIYRPILLVGGDNRNAPAMPLSIRVTSAIFKPLDYFRFLTCEIPVLGQVMVHQSLRPAKAKVEIYGNRDVHLLGQEINQRCTS